MTAKKFCGRMKKVNVKETMGRIGNTMEQKKRINGADLPFNIYHVDLRFFQINLNVKQRQIANKIQNLIEKFK
jgi:hypothetical protein